MDVDISDLMKQVNADDSEKSVLQGYLQRAKATVAVEINRPLSDLSDNEKEVFNQIVLGMATSFYLSRDNSGKNASKSYSSLNSLIEILRKPPLGVQD